MYTSFALQLLDIHCYSSWDMFWNYCCQILLRKSFTYLFYLIFWGSYVLTIHFQYCLSLWSPWELMWILYAMWCRFKSDEERIPVYHIVEETFRHLLNIFNKLVQIANPTIEVADLIKLICKIFWSSIYVCHWLLCFEFSFFSLNGYNGWEQLILELTLWPRSSSPLHMKYSLGLKYHPISSPKFFQI